MQLNESSRYRFAIIFEEISNELENHIYIYIYAKLHKRCITRMRASCMTKMLNINSKIVCLRDEKF